jgi:hypothetical protein
MHARLAQIKEKPQICLSIYPYRVSYPLKYRFGIRLFRFHLANMPDVFILPADCGMVNMCHSCSSTACLWSCLQLLFVCYSFVYCNIWLTYMLIYLIRWRKQWFVEVFNGMVTCYTPRKFLPSKFRKKCGCLFRHLQKQKCLISSITGAHLGEGGNGWGYYVCIWGPSRDGLS